MNDGSGLITHDDGVDSDTIETLRLTFAQARKFLAKVEELGLAMSEINLVRLGISDFDPSERDRQELAFDPANQHEPLLAEFDRDLVGLHLPLDGQADEGHQFEAVWKTAASMERFRRMLDSAWGLNCEYGVPGQHRALDQRH